MFSGNDLAIWAHNEKHVAENKTRQIAQSLDCPVGTSQEMVTCMRDRTVDEILDADFERYVSLN